MVRVAFLVGLVLVTALCGGCREINPSYCAIHREDPDCLTSGVDLLDAPTMVECTTDLECNKDPKAPACDPVNHRCVTCVVGGNTAACSPTETCGADQRCHGCIMDGDCSMTSVCKLDQTCAVDGEVLFALPGGTGNCSRSAPCTFTAAVSALTQQAHIIKLLIGTSDTFTEPPITIDESFPVQIIGKGITFKPTGSGDAITREDGELQILGLRILEADGRGVVCNTGALALQEVTIASPTDRCIQTVDCNVRMTRSSLSRCGGGDALAMFIDKGQHEIRNNMISDTTSDGKGTVQLVNGTGRFAFNTIVRTGSPNGNKITAVGCSGTVRIAQNLVADYGLADHLTGGCVQGEVYRTQTVDDVRFVSTTDFHLTVDTPAGAAGVRDANTPDAVTDCVDETATGPIEDFDGVPRPYNNFCDRGADEFVPPP